MEIKEKSERKKQLIQVAEKLFKEKGYLATSVRDIAESLNIEAASLYSHIKSKEDLLLDIATRSADEFFEAIRPIAESGLKTRVKLTQMIVAHVEVITRNMDASAVFFREWTHLSEPNRSNYDKTRDEYEQIFRDVVQQGIAENLFLFYDERFTARAILSALNWTHTWYRPNGELKAHEIGENLAKILLNGLIRNM